MDCRLPGSSVHRISQARILEWVTIFFSQPRDWTHISCTAGGFFTTEPLEEPLLRQYYNVSHRNTNINTWVSQSLLMFFLYVHNCNSGTSQHLNGNINIFFLFCNLNKFYSNSYCIRKLAALTGLPWDPIFRTWNKAQGIRGPASSLLLPNFCSVLGCVREGGFSRPFSK